MKDHLISEEHQRIKCIYCTNEEHLSEWDKELAGDHLYRIFRCSCGHTTRIKMGHLGSGHDNWNGKLPEELSETKTSGKITELENIVSKVKDQFQTTRNKN
jgi:hypothetical protein